MKGPSPKPNVLKIAKGTRKDRLNRHEVAPVPGRPDCPDHLDAIGREEFEKIVQALEALGILSKTDAPVITLYCSSHSLWREAEAKVKAEGMIVPTDCGGATTSPYYRIARDARAACLRLLIELGLTPAARTRIKPDPTAAPGRGDELEAFLDNDPAAES